MIQDFFISINITENRVVKFLQLKNEQYFNLLKFIQNQDYSNLEDCFNCILQDLILDKTIYTSLNFIDKLICLLAIRSICIAPDIEFESKEKIKLSKKTSIYSIYKQLEDISYKERYTINNEITINLNIPKKIYYASFDDIVEGCIESVEIGDEIIYLDQQSVEFKADYINNLPGEVFTRAKEYLDNLETNLNTYTLIKGDTSLKLEQIDLSLLKNTGFGLLSSIYKDNLLNFYNLMYIFTSKIKASLSDYYKLTPAESSLLLTFYVKEQEETKKAHESKSIPLGKPVAK